MEEQHNDLLPDDFVSWLVDYDEALAAGASGSEESGSAAGRREPLDVQAAARLSRARDCLELIERVRRASAEGDESTLRETVHGASAGESWAPMPKRLGRFEIIRELGRGGCGVVFLAFDPNLEREIALKLPHPAVVLAPAMRERFLREGKAVASLNHASLLPVYEAGSAGPICYLAVAYCPGPSLREWLAARHSPVPLRSAASLLRSIADAMQHAHSRGIIHRDLKPSNVLLAAKEDGCVPLDREDNQAFVPQVTDFGLAKLDDDNGEQTLAGTILGTPLYMAPEQAAGRIEDIGPRTDVYAMGAMLYELLTGQPPLRGETDLATLRAIERAQPASLRRLRAEVPRDLEAVCLKCLEKEPLRRYGAASELADDLQRYLEDAPVRARHIGAAERAVRWCRRNPLVAGLSMVIVLLLVVLAVGSSAAALQLVVQRDRIQQARDQVDAQFREADRQRQRAESNLHNMRDAVDKMLTEVGLNQLVALPRLEPARRNLLEEALHYYEMILAEGGESPEARRDIAMALLRLGMMNRWLGDNAQAIDYLSRSADVFQALAAQEPVSRRVELPHAQALFQLAQVHVTLSQFEDAEGFYGRALEQQRSVPVAGDDDPERRIQLALTLSGLGHLQYKTSNLGESERNICEAIAVLREVCQKSESHEIHLELARGIQRLAVLQQNSRRFDAAEQSYMEARSLAEKVVQQRPLPDCCEFLADVRDKYGVFLLLGKRMEPAEVAIRSALRGRLELAGDYPSVPHYRAALASSYNNLAWLLSQAEKPVESEQAYRAGVELLAALQKECPTTLSFRRSLANTQNNLGILLLVADRFDEAEELARASLLVRQQVASEFPDVPKFQSELGASLHTLASLLLEQGRTEEAQPMIDDAVERQTHALESNEQDPTYRRFLSNHYSILADAQRQQRAYAAAMQTIERRSELYPDSWTRCWYGVKQLVDLRNRVVEDPELSANQRSELSESLGPIITKALRRTKSVVPPRIANPNELNNLSLLLAASPHSDLRDPKTAVEFMQRTVQQHPDHANASLFWATLGVARVENGDWQKGMEALEQAVEMDTKSTLGWFSLAIACHELGDSQRAKEHFEEGEKRFAATPDTNSKTRYVRNSAAHRLGVRAVGQPVKQQ